MKPTTIILTAIAMFAPCAAWADDAPDPEMQGPPTKAPSREGPTISISVGPGELHILPDASMTKETRIEGAGFSLRAGFTLSQVSTFDVIVDFIDSGGGSSSTRSTVLGGSLKFYTSDPLYLRVGGGLGMISRPGAMDDMGGGGGTDRLYGAAALFGIGYEWLQLRDIGLFGEFEVVGDRLLKSNVDTTIVNAALLFGITWY